MILSLATDILVSPVGVVVDDTVAKRSRVPGFTSREPRGASPLEEAFVACDVGKVATATRVASRGTLLSRSDAAIAQQLCVCTPSTKARQALRAGVSHERGAVPQIASGRSVSSLTQIAMCTWSDPKTPRTST